MSDATKKADAAKPATLPAAVPAHAVGADLAGNQHMVTPENAKALTPDGKLVIGEGGYDEPRDVHMLALKRFISPEASGILLTPDEDEFNATEREARQLEDNGLAKRLGKTKAAGKADKK